jgi:hypothetical protein
MFELDLFEEMIRKRFEIASICNSFKIIGPTDLEIFNFVELKKKFRYPDLFSLTKFKYDLG